VFNISENLPPYLDLKFTDTNPKKGKLNPDDPKPLKVTFMSKEEMEVKDDIMINLRGGKPLVLQVQV
jgi:hypothetical protein